jgi:hypothetical protein
LFKVFVRGVRYFRIFRIFPRALIKQRLWIDEVFPCLSLAAALLAVAPARASEKEDRDRGEFRRHRAFQIGLWGVLPYAKTGYGGIDGDTKDKATGQFATGLFESMPSSRAHPPGPWWLKRCVTGLRPRERMAPFPGSTSSPAQSDEAQEPPLGHQLRI